MSKKLTTEEFIERAREIHGDKYDYSNVVYINARSNVYITCNMCNHVFNQTPDHHVNRGDGCPKCRDVNNGKNKRLSVDEIIKRSIIANHNRYDYSITTYALYHNRMVFICPIHGKVSQYVKHHINGVGCPKCKESKGEQKIRLYLEQNDIEYIRENTFDDCKYKRLLPFDFYLPKHNICIEFDGEQHFNPVRYSKDNTLMISKLHNIHIRDDIKTRYCIKNNIGLIRIPYWDINNINTILHDNITRNVVRVSPLELGCIMSSNYRMINI